MAVVEVERCSVEIGRTPEGRRICCEARIEVPDSGLLTHCWAGHAWRSETLLGQLILVREAKRDTPIAARAMP